MCSCDLVLVFLNFDYKIVENIEWKNMNNSLILTFYLFLFYIVTDWNITGQVNLGAPVSRDPNGNDLPMSGMFPAYQPSVYGILIFTAFPGMVQTMSPR